MQVVHLIKELCLKAHMAHSLTLLPGICPARVALLACHSVSLLPCLKNKQTKKKLIYYLLLTALITDVDLFVYSQAPLPSSPRVSLIWAETVSYTALSVARAVAVVGVH